MSRTRLFLVRWNDIQLIGGEVHFWRQGRGMTGTYHALQSLGELVGLEHIFAFLMFGPVHHLWAIVNRLFCKKSKLSFIITKADSSMFPCFYGMISASMELPQLKLMAPMSSRYVWILPMQLTSPQFLSPGRTDVLFRYLGLLLNLVNGKENLNFFYQYEYILDNLKFMNKHYHWSRM